METKNSVNRKKLYLFTKKSLANINHMQCLVPIKKDNKYMYDIANGKLTLKKQIGTASKFGVVYLTLDNKKHKFATKLTPITLVNRNEILLEKKLGELVIKDKSPHFLLIYKVLNCLVDNNEVPELIKNQEYYISINELADGDLYNFILKFKHMPNMIKNTLQQIFLSVLSFHYFTGGYYHKDAHLGNFLYHKIKPGGYFKYIIFGKTVYVENLGYLWMIWDFGKFKKTEEFKKLKIEDYFKPSRNIKKIYKKEDNVYNVLKSVENLEFEILYTADNITDKSFFQDYLFKLPSFYLFSIPSNSKIINKKPYVIEDFE